MNAPLYPTPPSVVAQIANLPCLPMPEIRALWQQLFDAEAPTHNRQFLERRLAYRLQENAFRTVAPDLLDCNPQGVVSFVEFVAINPELSVPGPRPHIMGWNEVLKFLGLSESLPYFA